MALHRWLDRVESLWIAGSEFSCDMRADFMCLCCSDPSLVMRGEEVDRRWSVQMMSAVTHVRLLFTCCPLRLLTVGRCAYCSKTKAMVEELLKSYSNVWYATRSLSLSLFAQRNL
eukprot:1686555-Rhodomonas_salina.1